MTDEGSLQALNKHRERSVYIISRTACPPEPGLGAGVSQAALGVGAGTPERPCLVPPGACLSHFPPEAQPPRTPAWEDWSVGGCSRKGASAARGGVWGPGAMTPGRSTPGLCLLHWLLTFDGPETLLSPWEPASRPMPLEHSTQLALNSCAPWKASEAGLWALHTADGGVHHNSHKSQPHFHFPYYPSLPHVCCRSVCSLSVSLEGQPTGCVSVSFPRCHQHLGQDLARERNRVAAQALLCAQSIGIAFEPHKTRKGVSWLRKRGHLLQVTLTERILEPSPPPSPGS